MDAPAVRTADSVVDPYNRIAQIQPQAGQVGQPLRGGLEAALLARAVEDRLAEREFEALLREPQPA